MKGDTKLTVTLIVFAILIAGGYFAYKYFIPQINSVLPTSSGNPNSNQTGAPITGNPTIIDPKVGSKATSPLKIRGTVPPGWMFEGVFPISLVDSNHKLIVSGQATEEVPGSWQGNTIIYFDATLTFSTTAKTGFIVLESDNPSGLPDNTKTFEVPVNY